jgi:hypothetical protein
MKNEAELSPERYRELAVKALQRAQAAKTQTERRYFIEQATIWQRLADAGFNDAARHNFAREAASRERARSGPTE